jgi:diguanylate cyclase (GGDEF)-like protein/putative nucleotidyltransferase with HDIG domain
VSVKVRVAAGFGFLCLVFAVAATLSMWQGRIHRSDLAALDRHSSTATLLQEAEAQAGFAALLVQRQVMAGDEDPAEIQQYADAAEASLLEAIAHGAPPSAQETAVAGAGLVQGASRVLALRDAGDVEGAREAMEGLVPIFREYRALLEGATAYELDQVESLRVSAERAGDLAFIFLIASGLSGIFIALATAFLISRSIIKPLSSLEAVAVAASRGDLSVRAAARGPRELAHLGSVLNDMMEAVEERTVELRLANEELRERNRQLMDARAQAATDALTGLGNHRTFHKRIRDEVAIADRDGTSVGLIMFDIDRFKSVNDDLGHQAGDEILHDLSATLRAVIVRGDAYRYGGDEFAVVLPQSDQKSTIRVAEELRQATEKMTDQEGRQITISLGVAAYPEMAAAADELIYRADMAMYWAKSTGKNRVGNWDGMLSRRGNENIPEFLRDRGERTPDTVAALVAALSAKDAVTRDHIERCSWYAAELAEELGLSEEQSSVVKLAALLHDIGKLAMPDDVLCKDGPLNEDEWSSMKEHPTVGRHMLSQVGPALEALPAIVHHHEHYDGSGYPDGLAGEEIPIASRILLVTDAFDAMTTDRPYRKAMTIDAAIEELKVNSGKQFDPAIVEAFLGLLKRNGAHPLRSACEREADASTALAGADDDWDE